MGHRSPRQRYSSHVRRHSSKDDGESVSIVSRAGDVESAGIDQDGLTGAATGDDGKAIRNNLKSGNLARQSHSEERFEDATSSSDRNGLGTKSDVILLRHGLGKATNFKVAEAIIGQEAKSGELMEDNGDSEPHIARLHGIHGGYRRVSGGSSRRYPEETARLTSVAGWLEDVLTETTAKEETNDGLDVGAVKAANTTALLAAPRAQIPSLGFSSQTAIPARKSLSDSRNVEQSEDAEAVATVKEEVGEVRNVVDDIALQTAPGAPTPSSESSFKQSIPARKPPSYYKEQQEAQKAARLVTPIGVFAEGKSVAVPTRAEWKEEKAKKKAEEFKKKVPNVIEAFRKRTEIPSREGRHVRKEIDKITSFLREQHFARLSAIGGQRRQVSTFARWTVKPVSGARQIFNNVAIKPRSKASKVYSNKNLPTLATSAQNLIQAHSEKNKTSSEEKLPTRSVSEEPGMKRMPIMPGSHFTDTSSRSSIPFRPRSTEVGTAPRDGPEGQHTNDPPSDATSESTEPLIQYQLTHPEFRHSKRSSTRADWDKFPLRQLYGDLDRFTRLKDGYGKVCEMVTYLMERGEEPSLRLYDALIRANTDAANGDVDVVRKLLKEMKDLGIQPDSGCYHGIIHVLAVHPDYLLRDKILREMKLKWFGLSPEGWHYYVAGLVRDRQYEMAMDKLEQMHTDEIVVQPWLYDIFLFQLGEIGELEEAFRLLQLRYSTATRDIDASIWYYLLDQFAKHYHYAGVKYIWHRRVDPNMIVVPSDGICASVLNLAARYADPVLATSATKILSSRVEQLAYHHYEALLAAYANSDDIKTAIRILSVMSKINMEPNARTTRPLYANLIQSSQRPHTAWKDMKELAADALSIPLAVPNVILEACGKVDSYDNAMALYKELHEIIPAGPNTETFNTLLQVGLYSKDDCMFLASEMAALNVPPDALTYDRLILASLPHEDYEDAFRYLEEMIWAGKDKDGGGWWMRTGTATLLVKRCVLAGDERARKVMAEMEKRGLDVWGLGAYMRDNWGFALKRPDTIKTLMRP